MITLFPLKEQDWLEMGHDMCCYCVSLQSTDNDALKEILKKKMDQDVKLVVYNSKSRTCRGNNRHLLVVVIVVLHVLCVLLFVGWE